MEKGKLMISRCSEIRSLYRNACPMEGNVKDIFLPPRDGENFFEPEIFSHVRYLEPPLVLHPCRNVTRGGFRSVADCARSGGDLRSKRNS